MEAIEQHIARLEQKTAAIIQILERTREENNSLRLKINELEGALKEQKNKLDEASDTNKLTKLAEGLQSMQSEGEDVKSLLNDYIKEIDRCIAVLKR